MTRILSAVRLLAMPLRVLLTGQVQTPSVDAVVALFPRDVVLKRLAVA